VLAVAHRAGNDLQVLREAALLGADVVEADVHLHRGRLEVRHEKSVGRLPWLWDKWQVYPRTHPRMVLDELLDALPLGTTVMLDLKGVGRAGAEVALAVHARAPEHPVLVCARWWPAVAPFRELPWARVLLSARGRVELARLRRRLRAGDPPDGVSVHLSMLDPLVVAELKEQVPLVLTWPVDDLAALERASFCGVDGAITKDLDIVGRILGARRQEA
jgi:glycerophosphoryl diester phosphodiesterase